MTKLPQVSRMGVGVTEVVEMYATSICDTEPIVRKAHLQSIDVRQGLKRRMSDQGGPDSPKVVAGSLRSPRRERESRSPSPALPHSTDMVVPQVGHPTPSCETRGEEEEDEEKEMEEIVKRARLESSPTSHDTCSSSSSAKESYDSRRRRFLRTAEALRQSGLLDITMKTAALLRKNQALQQQIENLQKETRSFVMSVLTNPENRPVLDSIQSKAQMYEVIVPGSQRIMSVSTLPGEVDDRTTPTSTVSNDSLTSQNSMTTQDNMSSPSPSETFTDDTFSDDCLSSEEENLSPPDLIMPVKR